MNSVLREALAGSAPRRGARRRVRPLRALAGFVLLLGVLSAGRAQAYRFLNDGWHPEVWPLGGTLSVALVDDPEWHEHGFSLEEVRSRLQQALDLWAAVPSADIRWEMGPTITLEEREEEIARYRKRFPITIQPMGDAPNPHVDVDYAPGEDLVAIQCNAYVSVPSLRLGDPYFRDDDFWGTAAHELGHCLGLHHPDAVALTAPRAYLEQRSLIAAGAQPSPDLGAGRIRTNRGWRPAPSQESRSNPSPLKCVHCSGSRHRGASWFWERWRGRWNTGIPKG